MLLQAWAADGTLPNVAALAAGGLTGDTRSVEGFFVGGTWPSFYTGADPSGHGIYWLDQLKPGTYEKHRLVPEDFARRPALWEILSGAGRRVAVLDVPLTRRSPALNGVQTVEWGVHDAAFGFQAAPNRLEREIIRQFGRHPAPANCDASHRSPADYRELANQLVRGAASRARLTRWILAQEPWDFTIQVFSEAHCAGHQLWHFHDPAHPAYDPTAGDLVRDVYVAIDQAVGEILADVDPGVTVVLVALHGMSCMCGAAFLLPQVLARLGVTTPVRAMRTAASPPVQAGFMSRLAEAYRLLPASVRAPVYQVRQRMRRGLPSRKPAIRFDPARTKCFAVETGFSASGIRLNIAGREPQGILARGTEADAFCDQLTRDLLELVHPDTGAGLVKRVRRTADLYPGERLDDLPDLLVEWELEPPLGTTVAGNGAGAVMKAFSSRTGLLELTNTYCRTGEHRIEGMFVARGPGIAPGRLDRVVSNLDLAPTFARLLGCEMPAGDGHPIPELIQHKE